MISLVGCFDCFVDYPLWKPVIRGKLPYVPYFFIELICAAESFGTCNQGSYPSQLMIELRITVVVDELSCVRFLAIYRYSIRVYLEIKEMWYTIFEFINSEFEIFVEFVKLLSRIC